MNKTNLYLFAALIWGIPGIIISVKGWPMLVVAACRFIRNRKVV